MSGSFGLNRSRSDQHTYIDPQQKNHLMNIWDGARTLSSNATPQNMVAGFTPMQQAGQDYAANYAGYLPSLYGDTQGYQQQLAGPTSFENYSNAIAPFSFGSMASAMGGPSGQYGDALNRMMSGSVNTQAYDQVADSITNRMSKAFNENVLPGIRRNSLQASGVPTSRASIPTQQAASQFSQDLGATLNNLYLPAYQQAQQQVGQGAGLYSDAMNRSLNAAQSGAGLLGQSGQLGSQNLYNAMSFSPQLAQLGYMPSQILQDVGATQQGQNQRYLDAPWDAYARYSDLVGPANNIGSGRSSAWGLQTSGSFNGAGMMGGS